MSRRRKEPEVTPQVLAIAKISRDGRISLRKRILQYLQLDGKRRLYIDRSREVFISSKKQGAGEPIVIERNGIRLPQDVLKRLQVGRGKLVGFVERAGALAIKAFEVTEVEGREARWIDIETPIKITRQVETNPLPEAFLAQLSKRQRSLRLRNNDVHTFLEQGQTVEALLARQSLGTPRASDQLLRQALVRERSEKQEDNGSWESCVTITARNLQELAALGMSPRSATIRRAVDWLLVRPESPYNPGLWFAYDELVQEQAEVIELRKQHTGKGPRPRFNQSRAREVNLVRAGDPAIVDPCGPRIMWTSALVLEALLSLGFEKKKRVQTALRTLLINPNWCDNTYQHGLSCWKQTEPIPLSKLDTIEKHAIQFYRYGGIRSPQELLESETVNSYRRVGWISRAVGDTFLLRMPFGIGEGCKIIMTRALTRVRQPELKKVLRIRLWEFAAMLNLTEERLVSFKGHEVIDRAVFFLQIFSRSDQPVAKLGLARMLPWLVEAQNRDGSWGQEPFKDAATCAVVQALVSLGEHLPSGFIGAKRR